MNDSARLSVVIPVYNGADTLADAVERIARLYPDLEIVISDNASTDRTRAVSLDLASRYPGVRYFRNESNVGFDRNCHAAVERATGDFCWLLGDDDLIADEGITRVRSVLRANPDLGVVFVNYACRNRATGEVFRERDCPLSEDHHCPPGLEFVRHVGAYPNFVSTLVFRREAWMRADYHSYFGSYFVHYGVVLDVVRQYSSYCIADPLVINNSRISNAPREPDFWANSINVILALLDIALSHPLLRDAERERRALAQSIMTRYLLNKIKLAKVNGGRITADQSLRAVKLLKGFPRFWFYLPLMIIPYSVQLPVVRLRNALLKR